MNIDFSKYSKQQLYSVLAVGVTGLWLIIEIFRGDISFSANWNILKSPLGNICLFIGLIMSILWWGKLGHWSATPYNEYRDELGNVVKRERNWDVVENMGTGCIMPFVGHFLIEPLIYGALIFYPIQCIIHFVGAIFPYVVVLLIVGLIAATWLLADSFTTGRRRKAFIAAVAVLSLAMAFFAFAIHHDTNRASQAQQMPAESSTPAESPTPAEGTEASVVSPSCVLKADGIYADGYSVKLGEKAADLADYFGGIYARREYVDIDDKNPEEVGMDEVTGWYFYDEAGNLLLLKHL